MKIIKPSTLVEWTKIHPASAKSLLRWLEIARKARWSTFSEVRRHIPSAEMVKVGSLKPVFIFNIAVNQFRLIAAIHFNTCRLFLLDFMTHADYSKDDWNGRL